METWYNGQGKLNFSQGKVSENQGISFEIKSGHPEIWCVSYSHEWGVQSNFFCPAP